MFAVVYTVDFEYSVNGKMYQFSLPGGGFVSLTDLVEVLGIIGDTNPDKNDEEIDAVEEQDANGLLDVTASDAAKKFVADVASVEFSSPELVWVGKVENETIVDALKEVNGLECEYSAELTIEQIEKINAQTVEAGDWALISMQPFISEAYRGSLNMNQYLELPNNEFPALTPGSNQISFGSGITRVELTPRWWCL